MSQNWLRVIATDPTWVPDHVADARGKTVLQQQAPGAEEVSTKRFSEITFVGRGWNFEAVYCPICEAKLSIPWWQKKMDASFESAFANLRVTTPCCGRSTTLNGLRYDWPMGFARWELVAVSPGRSKLNEDEMIELEQAIGHGLRQIWTHI
jgi:hypothetical protein